MKFTKKQLLDTLKGKLTANGKHLSISDKTITSLSDSHYDLLVNEETELDDFVSRILPQFVTLNGNYEKDNADFIKSWQKDHPSGNGGKGEGNGNADDNGNGNGNGNSGGGSPELTALLERLKKLEEKEAAVEAEKVLSQKRSELRAKLKEKGVKDEKWAETYLKKLTITNDSDLDKEAADALEFYNMAHSSTTHNTPGGSGGSETKTDWSDVINIINPDAGK
jgi:hypothetical protein